METRKCWKCQQEKELTNIFFYRDKKDTKGFQKRCKECNKKIGKKFREKNPDYASIKGKENYKQEDNVKRYQKYKDSFLTRRDEQRRSVRGRLGELLSSAKDRAKKKNLPIEIDIDFLLNLYEQQEGKCKLTGLQLMFERNQDRKIRFMPFSPSLDKIDASKGYTKDNTRLVCTIVNLALNNFGEDTFRIMCQAYINKSKSE